VSEAWPPDDAIGIRLRIGDTAGTSYITEESTRELVARLRQLQTAMGSAQLVAGELEHQANDEPDKRVTLALFGEQAGTIIAAIDAWEQDGPLPGDVDALRTALASS
jgi:hypothetical protein